jgi:hypothetical protein
MDIKRLDSKPLEFVYEDVVFFVKPRATEEDRMFVQLSGTSVGGAVKFSRPEYCKALIQSMVIGWKGVKIDGQEIRYEYELLADFPKVKDRNVYIELGSFILVNTDIKKQDTELKKD